MVAAASEMRASIGVIGAGPAGIAAVGHLLDNSNHRIFWIADSFDDAGRLSQFSEVPSNTITELFVKFVTCPAFKYCWEQSNTCTAYEKLLKLDCQKGCQLHYIRDALIELILMMKQYYSHRIEFITGHCSSIKASAHHASLRINNYAETIDVQAVILATGCHPKTPLSLPNFPHLQVASPEQFLNPSQTEKFLLVKDKRVAIVGSSHSAILILMNLVNSINSPKAIVNFYREPLKYATPLSDGRVQHENTGLKESVARWAREHLGDATNCCGGLITRKKAPTDYNEEATLKDIDIIIWAIGYERNDLPQILVNSQEVKVTSYTDMGQLLSDAGVIPGLYGVGIAFPERVLDTDGMTPEMSVGMWKFWNHSRKVVASLLASLNHQ